MSAIPRIAVLADGREVDGAFTDDDRTLGPARTSPVSDEEMMARVQAMDARRTARLALAHGSRVVGIYYLDGDERIPDWFAAGAAKETKPR